MVVVTLVVTNKLRIMDRLRPHLPLRLAIRMIEKGKSKGKGTHGKHKGKYFKCMGANPIMMVAKLLTAIGHKTGSATAATATVMKIGGQLHDEDCSRRRLLSAIAMICIGK